MYYFDEKGTVDTKSLTEQVLWKSQNTLWNKQTKTLLKISCTIYLSLWPTNIKKTQFNSPAKQTEYTFLRQVVPLLQKVTVTSVRWKWEHQCEVTMWAGFTLHEDWEGKP